MTKQWSYDNGVFTIKCIDDAGNIVRVTSSDRKSPFTMFIADNYKDKSEGFIPDKHESVQTLKSKYLTEEVPKLMEIAEEKKFSSNQIDFILQTVEAF